MCRSKLDAEGHLLSPGSLAKFRPALTFAPFRAEKARSPAVEYVVQAVPRS